MKTAYYLFICLIGILMNNPANAQTNHYLENAPFWGISAQCGYEYPCVAKKDYNYYTNGDTIINTLVYKKIAERGQSYKMWYAPAPVGPACSDMNVYPYSATPFFLRSEDKKMFIIFYGETTEHLLYDFDLEVGDTLPVTYNNPDEHITVTEIDNVSTPFGARKRFKLSQEGGSGFIAQYLIEGVGTDFGLIEPVYGLIDCANQLTCYGLNNASYYPATGPSCYLSIDKEEQLVKLTASPNPFTSSTTLQLNTQIENGELIMYNLHGQKVRSLSVIGTSTITINREDLTEGMYFLSLNQNGNAISLGKIIVSD